MADIDAVLISGLHGVVELTPGRTRAISAAFISSADGTIAAHVVRSRSVQAAMICSLDGAIVAGAVRERAISGDMRTGLLGQIEFVSAQSRGIGASMVVSLHGRFPLISTPARRISARLIASMEGRLIISGVNYGRSVCELVRESLQLWGFLCGECIPRYARERALGDLNTALQMVWNNAEGHEYWSNQTITINMTTGESSVDLDDDIQRVIGPCRRADNDRPLTPIQTIGELKTFSDLYLEGDTADEPLAYHVERQNQVGNDPAKCTFHVTPAVSEASVDFLLRVIKEAPRYDMTALTTCPIVPIPHQYVETLLVPILRYLATTFYLYSNTDEGQKATIDREYLQAKISLGLADPNPIHESAKEESKGGSR